jgi:hypothetical protein
VAMGPRCQHAPPLVEGVLRLGDFQAAMPRQVNDLDLQGEVSLDREWSSGKSCVRVDERKRQGYLRPFWSLISYYKGQIE